MKLDIDQNGMPFLRCEHCNDPVTLSNGIIAGEEHPGDLYMMSPSVYHTECLHQLIDIHGPCYVYCDLSKLIFSLLKGVAVSEAEMGDAIEEQQQGWYLQRLAEKEMAESERWAADHKPE